MNKTASFRDIGGVTFGLLKYKSYQNRKLFKKKLIFMGLKKFNIFEFLLKGVFI